MKVKVKVIKERLLSGDKVGQEKIMWIEDQDVTNNKVFLFGGVYEILEVLENEKNTRK